MALKECWWMHLEPVDFWDKGSRDHQVYFDWGLWIWGPTASAVNDFLVQLHYSVAEESET
jgi:hypothetical protein